MIPPTSVDLMGRANFFDKNKTLAMWLGLEKKTLHRLHRSHRFFWALNAELIVGGASRGDF